MGGREFVLCPRKKKKEKSAPMGFITGRPTSKVSSYESHFDTPVSLR